MKVSLLYKLKAATDRAAALQRDWERQKRKLLALPGRLGFASLQELQAALALVTDNMVPTKRFGHSKQHGRSTPSLRRKRSVITPRIRAQVKEMVERKKTNNEIAKALDISAPSVQNIKKALGLVKTRK